MKGEMEDSIRNAFLTCMNKLACSQRMPSDRRILDTYIRLMENNSASKKACEEEGARWSVIHEAAALKLCLSAWEATERTEDFSPETFARFVDRAEVETGVSIRFHFTCGLRLLYEYYMQGYSLKSCLHMAGAERSVGWLRSVFDNKIYMGTEYWRQIIPEDVWRQANAQAKRRGKSAAGRKKEALRLERAEYARQGLQARLLLELTDSIRERREKVFPPRTEREKDMSGSCADPEDFFRRTRHPIPEDIITEEGFLIRFEDSFIVRYLDHVTVLDEEYEIHLKAGIRIHVKSISSESGKQGI